MPNRGKRKQKLLSGSLIRICLLDREEPAFFESPRQNSTDASLHVSTKSDASAGDVCVRAAEEERESTGRGSAPHQQGGKNVRSEEEKMAAGEEGAPSADHSAAVSFCSCWMLAEGKQTTLHSSGLRSPFFCSNLLKHSAQPWAAPPAQSNGGSTAHAQKRHRRVLFPKQPQFSPSRRNRCFA